MSYLDYPRIHFSGGFMAGPSTINNLPNNYKPSVNPKGQALGWNPGGNAYIKLQNCTVKSVVLDKSGPSQSALDGKPVITTDNWGNGKIPAKIVDLDPEQQMVSMLYGIQLKIGSGDNYVIAEMEPMWFQNFKGHYASYQSVLKPTEWGANLSGVLAKLKEKSPNVLSIKFIIGPPRFGDNGPMSGNIYGTIGAADEDAPINFVPARYLRPNNEDQKFNFSPAQVVRDGNGKPDRLTIDLGSSATMSSSTTLTAWARSAKTGTVKLGTLDYNAAMLEQRALVLDIDLSNLSPQESNLLATSPIIITNGDSTESPSVLEEDEHGVYVNASPYVFRMEADSTTEVSFWATTFGRPAQMEITVADQSSQLLGSSARPPVGQVGADGTLVGWISPDGTREDYPALVTTGLDGKGKLTIAGGNPMNFRKYIDGQVYALQFTPQQAPAIIDQNNILSLLVHDAFDVEPIWDNINPIMAQYAKLYPVMAKMGIQLDNPESLLAHKQALIHVFSLPIEDPHYMPVVRDLSVVKRNAIVTWLNNNNPA